MRPSLVLDANVLVLLIVGLIDRQLIASHKRSRQFTDVDFDLLADTIAGFDLVVTTSVLTEASNLLAYTHDALKERLLAGLGQFVVGVATEIRPKALLSSRRRSSHVLV